MMNNENRLLAAIAISILIILAYQSYVSRYYKPYHKPYHANVEQKESQGAVSQEHRTDTPKKYEKSTQQKEKISIIENEPYHVELTDAGASIKMLSLHEYKASNGMQTELLKDEGHAPRVLETQDLSVTGTQQAWQEIEKTADTIIYKIEDDNKVVTKEIKFYKSKYIIGLGIIFKNKTAAPQELYYKIYGGPGIIVNESMDPRYLNAGVQTGEKIYRKKPGSKEIKNGGCEIFNEAPVWVSSTSRYFSFVLKPEQEETKAFIEGVGKNNLTSGVIIGPIRMEPAEVLQRRYTLYAGPNDIEKMRSLNIPTENVVDYGILSAIAQVIFKTLRFFYNIFGNYGLAIISLALVISIILFPLTRKSLNSMKEMQKIQPEIEKIRKDYSDNPQKMNKEVMELYKKHKVSPFGGCLPMVLQFPIFIALYNVFTRSVELKSAKFLWIKDLSEPDAAFRLPYTLPLLGGYLHILPILMAIAMVLQQKLTQPKGIEVSEQQRMMATLMPIFMCVIFYNLPSGLVLYWLFNTLIMLLLQEVVLKRKQANPA